LLHRFQHFANELNKSTEVPLVTARLLTSKLEDDKMSESDRWVLEDFLLTTIDMFSQDMEECSKQILRIPVLHPHFEVAAVEIIFCEMLRLPAPPFLPLFYSRLLEAIAEKQESVKKLVEQAYDALFEKISDLDEECLDVLFKKAQAEEEFGAQPTEPWALEDVAELVAFVMLQNGLQTPSHMNKLMDGNQEILLKLRPTDESQAHGFAKRVARCVFDFWKFSAQRLEIVMDSFLRRGVVTPRAVVEVALADGGLQGCDSIPVWNVVNTVARRSLDRSQSVHVELTLAKKLGKEDAAQTSCKQLEEAIHENAELFSLIFTSLVANYQSFENRDPLYRQITLKRIESIGRKYLAGITPLVDAAESRISGVAQHPEIAAVFTTLSTLP